MKWEEVRKIYPDKFVKLEVLNSHIEGNQEYVDEVAVIDTVSEEDATKEFLKSKDNVLVYHTSKKDITLKIRSRIGLRGVFRNEN
ncbi:hypothetical protein U472_12520 [Orenia metallireducens]|uniref:Uncharacterized protein n=1 Tax=Orenia metallireducens TaxID=1413210 RepID=A0A1C0A4W8_9FIRM|nr:hypothetical protein [Orenia metallireducens]OCL25188.1 hypothetical protein U472_12520 [Orenia metallireducens]